MRLGDEKIIDAARKSANFVVAQTRPRRKRREDAAYCRTHERHKEEVKLRRLYLVITKLNLAEIFLEILA
jgi:hypothetical protein